MQNEPKNASEDAHGVHLDYDRQRRCGFHEVIYAEGKTPETLVEIFHRQAARGILPLATRVKPEQAEMLRAHFPAETCVENPVARTFRLVNAAACEQKKDRPRIAVLTAGTSDLPVAEEARETALWMGVDVVFIPDVGVAGPHRLIQRISEFADCAALVVVAGMEGALPSVVAGHVAVPVIAVPTSVGYGANLGGISALLSMLNSCAANVSVVNIDAGFKGGYLAGMIAVNQKLGMRNEEWIWRYACVISHFFISHSSFHSTPSRFPAFARG